VCELSTFIGELCAERVADHRERYPCADEQAVAAHQATALLVREEGTPKLFGCAAVFAKAVAGRQVEDSDADDREKDQAGDPDIVCDVVVVDAREEETADHGDEKGKDGAELLWDRRVGIRMVEGHDTDGDREKDDSHEGVGKEQECLATQVAHGLVLRDVSVVRHGYPSKGYPK